MGREGMKDLIIVCDDLFGLEVRMIVEKINESQIARGCEPPYRIAGYLVSENSGMRRTPYMAPILGVFETWQPLDGVDCAMAITDPARKRRAVDILKNAGAHFATLVSPWVLVPKKVTYGEGSIIAAQSIKSEASIGSFVTLFQSMLANATVGDFCSVMAFANITDAHLEPGVYVGNNASIMVGNTVQRNSRIDPNSVVVKSVKADMRVSGIPARRVKP